MPANVDNPEEIVACAEYTAPDGLAAENCYVQKNKFGPGRNLYWRPDGTGFPATPTAASIATAITDGKLIGPIVGEYTYAGTQANTVRNNSRDIVVPSDLAWNIKITDITPASRELARQSQNGGLTGKFYIVDMNSDWHGGQNGICEGSGLLQASLRIPAGENDLQSIEGTIKGRGQYDALVIESLIPVVY